MRYLEIQSMTSVDVSQHRNLEISLQWEQRRIIDLIDGQVLQSFPIK